MFLWTRRWCLGFPSLWEASARSEQCGPHHPPLLHGPPWNLPDAVPRPLQLPGRLFPSWQGTLCWGQCHPGWCVLRSVSPWLGCVEVSATLAGGYCGGYCGQCHPGRNMLRSASPWLGHAEVSVTLAGMCYGQQHPGWGVLRSVSPWLGCVTVSIILAGVCWGQCHPGWDVLRSASSWLGCAEVSVTLAEVCWVSVTLAGVCWGKCHPSWGAEVSVTLAGVCWGQCHPGWDVLRSVSPWSVDSSKHWTTIRLNRRWVISFFIVFNLSTVVLSVILSLDKGDYPENVQIVCLCHYT